MADEKVWFVHRTGRDLVGPVAADLIYRGFKEGKIPEDSIVAREGDDEWIPVGDLVARLDLFEDDPTRHNVSPFLTDVHPAVRVEQLELPPGRHLGLATSAKASSGRSFMVFIPGSREPPRGPWTLEEIRSRRESGALLATAKVCAVGDHRWESVDEVIALGDGTVDVADVPPMHKAGSTGSAQDGHVVSPPASPKMTIATWWPAVRQRRVLPAVGLGALAVLVSGWLVRSRPGGAVIRPSASSVAFPAPATPEPSPSAMPSTAEANQALMQAERRRLLESQSPEDWKRLVEKFAGSKEAEEASQKLREHESICSAKGKWSLTPAFTRLAALGPLVVTGHDMATRRASLVAISEILVERVTNEIQRLEGSVWDIEAHSMLPGEEKVKKGLVADHKAMIATNKRWKAAMSSYSGSLDPFDGLTEASTATITKISSNDVTRFEACLALAKGPGSKARPESSKPAAPAKKVCSSCTYNGRCARLGGPLPCCEPIVDHVLEDPMEAARCRQLGM